MSSIVLNIVEPGSSTPIEPVVPDTGLSTSGVGGAEAAFIVTFTLVVILAIVGAIIYHKKKHGKSPSLLARFKHTKSTTGLAVLALLVSIGTVAGLVKLTTSAIEGNAAENVEDSSALTVDVSSTELTIELADKPVFAVLPVDITIAEATDLGYTLTAYTDSTNLVSTTDSSKVIPMVTVDAEDVEDVDEEASEEEAEPLDSSLVALSPNTYGLSLVDPESALDEVFISLSTDSTNPTFITDKSYEATEAEDTTTIYYGFYITPDTPYGTYTGSNITVDAIQNMATVTYNANGLYFNDSEEDTTNTVGYKPNIAEAPIELVTGEYLTPAPLTPADPSTTIHYTFLGWSEDEDATVPTYTNEEDILANLTLTKNESLTLYAVWHYDTTLSFNGTTSDGGVAMEGMIIPAGSTITLPQNTYTRTGSVFTGWNTVENPTPENPGTAYADEASFTAPDTSADITLYAQWAYTTIITFNGNGATSGSMSPQTVVAGTPQNLTQNTFTKTNATFIGWNTQANGSGTSYSDEAGFTASTEQHEDITLYAQWAYTTISFNGNTSDSGSMNSVTIAGGTTSNLPANTYAKTNCIFTGWNTAAEGTGTSYGNSSPYTASATAKEEFTLYAQWQCISQVNYYGNGATSGEMASSIILGGGTLTFPQNSYAKDGYIFNGWNTQPDGTGTPYPDQGTFTAPMSPATTLNLYAQWLPTTTITFNGNDATSGSMSDQVIVAGTPQNLTPNAFAKDGYVFNGWNTVQTPTTENPGTVYADKAQYAASTTQPGSITLYAQWKQVFYMQDVATWGSTLSQGDTMEAVDKRDGQEYTVARLNDGKIWMTKNLNLAGGTEITSELSNVPDDYTLPTANGFQSGNKLPTSSTSGFNNDTKAFVYNSTKTSGTDCSDPGCYSYYSWTAATAGSGISITSGNTDAPYSICPKGWKLPNSRSTVAGNSDFYQLAVAYGMDPSATSQSTSNFFSQAGPGTTPNFLLTGRYGSGSFNYGGNNGNYWSSTSYNSTNARYLYFSSSYVDSAYYINRRYGYAVRCVAE